MSRALVALDCLRELTDGTPADLAALLSEIVAAAPIAGPWQQVRSGPAEAWSRESVVWSARSTRFPARVEIGRRAWVASSVGFARRTLHDSAESARDACDERLRALVWTLL